LSWLERVPTYKEALEQVKDKDLHNYGFLGYPCLQTADIVIYSEEGTTLFVPVGEDQATHVELSREIVRRFNGFNGFQMKEELWTPPVLFNVASALGIYRPIFGIDLDRKPITQEQRAFYEQEIRRKAAEYGLDNFIEKVGLNVFFFKTLLCEPQVMLTKTPRIPGLDGRKMSKSYGNAITLSETDEEIRKKTKVMVTDPARKRRTDPGNPDVCPVYDWHKLFSAGEPGRLEWVRNGCTTAGIGCIECKAAMAENLIKWIAPVRERRVKWENDPKGVVEMIEDGSKRARVEAKKTMERVREAVFHWKDKRREGGGDAAGPRQG
jgi:tryptophanyl-tRNA synthetase